MVCAVDHKVIEAAVGRPFSCRTLACKEALAMRPAVVLDSWAGISTCTRTGTARKRVSRFWLAVLGRQKWRKCGKRSPIWSQEAGALPLPPLTKKLLITLKVVELENNWPLQKVFVTKLLNRVDLNGSSINDVKRFDTFFYSLHCHALQYWGWYTVVTKSLTPSVLP